MNLPLSYFLSGAILLGFWAIGFFFLRFWMKTRDGLFGTFAAAFWVLGIERVVLLMTDPAHELRPFVYLIRLFAFLLAGNWPEWRGPTQDGVSPEAGLPLSWSSTEHVKWKVPLPDIGNSTPIVWEDKVFLTQAIAAESRRALMCFDRKDGKLLWQWDVHLPGQEPSHPTNPQCSASPVTDGERVIAWVGSAGLVACDMNGKELWKQDLGRQTHEWGYAASPIIYKDLCILNFGPGERSFVVALNKITGEEVWRVDVPEVQPEFREDGFKGRQNGVIGSWSTPIIVPANGTSDAVKQGDFAHSPASRMDQVRARDELVISLPDWVKGFDPLTGKELWRCAGPNPLVYTTPLFGENAVVVMGGFHGPALAVVPGGRGDVTKTHLLWTTGRTPNRLGTGVIKDGHIYVMNMPGIAECIDLETGKTVWEERLRGRGPNNQSWASMVLAGDRIYIMNQSSETIVIKASPEFEVLAINSLDNATSNSSIVPSNGEFFIRTHKHLWCISGQPVAARR